MTPGLVEGEPLYTDSDGKMYIVRKPSSGSGFNVAKPSEVTVPGGASFRPNTVIGAASYVTDSNGTVYKSVLNSLKPSLISLNSTSKPNSAISCGGSTCPFVDSSGNLVGSSHTVKGLTPDQFVDTDVTNDDFYYSNASGELIQADNSRKMGIDNLPPNRLYPATYLLLSDLNGNLYSIGEAHIVQKVSGIKAAAGAYAPIHDHYNTDVWMTDRQGLMYQCNAATCTQMNPTVKFAPGQSTVVSGGSYAEANDGTVYALNYSSIGSTMVPTGYYTKDSTASTSPNDCVVQMPTTGAPVGLTSTGLTALSVLAIGYLTTLVRRRQTI